MAVEIGMLAALGTSVLWSFSSVLFTIGGKAKSPAAVNRTRILVALVIISLLHLAVLGSILPRASPSEWGYLVLSGVIGLAIGDALLFAAFIRIGPRLSMLIMALAPVVTTSVAWVIFDEKLPYLKVLSIVVALGGTAWVILERRRANDAFKTDATGLLLGFGGMMGQAVGLLLSKVVLDDGFDTLSATYIRMIGGALSLWIFTFIISKNLEPFKDFTQWKFMCLILVASIVGPVLGIWSSMVAIAYAPLGIASTLMSLAPILTIPLAYFAFKERVSWRAVLGTVVALIGVAGLF
ncbi:MAG TPA: DMT family transporter, partial [Euryarchaeota archaeon]|nr:DMT family transporter [Euryarchaeota archaeon]